jgi:hypothetical protein
MNRTAIAFMICLAAPLVGGCDDDTAPGVGSGVDASANADMTSNGFPAAPTLGTVIDRMGRPAVNTALNKPFEADDTKKNTAKDAYNKAPQAMWGTFVAEIAANLAIIDSLDGQCGNQAFYDSSMDASNLNAYGALATALADDELYLDTTVATCDPTKNYLSVEVGALLKTTPGSCGGRTPLDDVIDVSYSVLSGAFPSVVGDGVAKDGDNATASLSAFPFLTAPN